MANLSPQEPPAKRSSASVLDVIGCVDKQSLKADMGGSSARLAITALRQLAEQVAEGEPSDAAAVLQNIERLRERWARRHPELQSGTAKTYATRATTILTEYFRWEAAPDKYDPKRAPPKKEDAPKRATKTESAPTDPRVPPPFAVLERSCPLGAGRELRYALPVDGLMVKDAMRVAFHLITMCEDYDPTESPMQIMSTAMQRGA